MIKRNGNHPRVWLCARLTGVLLTLGTLAHAATKPEDLNITQRTLPNGMEVVVVENHGLPLVTLEIVVKNGAYTEPPEFDGLSHLYEHMFFKANKEIPSQELYMERLRELGAQWNGTTSAERVNYYMTVHNKNVREGVEFLRNALLYPLFKEDELRKEWPVVLGEFDRNEANPSFHLMREVGERMWYEYYSRKNTIGDRDVIFNATREQMKEIQSRYYVPNNSALFIGGDIDPEYAFEIAEEMFGDWERADDPHQKWPAPKHPPLKQTERVVVTGPVQTASVMIEWHGPSLKTEREDTYVADLLSFILGQSDSSFQKALVDTGLVDGVGLSYYSLVHTGPITLSASTSPDRLDTAWEAIQVEMEKFTDPDYYTEEQLQSAKNLLEISSIYEREQTSEYIHSLTFWWATAGLDYYVEYLDNLKDVTRQDIANFAKKYIAGKPRIEGFLIAPDQIEAVLIDEGADVVEAKSGSSDVAFGKPKTVDAAEVTTEEFEVDGLDVILRHNPANEIVVANLVLPGGLQFYGPERAGHEQVVLQTLDKGSKKFSKEEVSRTLDRTGASLSGSASTDYSTFTLRTLKRYLEENFAIFGDALASPLLTDEEVSLALERQLNAIKRQHDNPDAYVSILASRNFYRGHPYEAHPGGTEETISALDPEKVRTAHAELFTKGRMQLVVVGAVTKDELTELIKKHFADLLQGDAKPVEWKKRDSSLEKKILTDERQLPTNYVFGTFDVPNYQDEDYAALKLATAILDDRLFQEVRTRRNLSYAVAAMMSSRMANYGVLYVTTVRPNEAIQVMYDEIDKVIEASVSDKELRDKKEEIITGDLMGNQTNASQAGGMVAWEIVGGGWENEQKMIERIGEVTPAQVQAAAKKYLRNFSFAYIGDPKLLDETIFLSK